MRAQTAAILAQAISTRATRVKPLDRKVPQKMFALVSPFYMGKTRGKMARGISFLFPKSPSAPAPIRPFRASGFEGKETDETGNV